MRHLTNPYLWIFFTAAAGACAAFASAGAALFTLREQDRQTEEQRGWTTGGDSIVYYEPLRGHGRLAFFIRHAGKYPAYDVTVRVHAVIKGGPGVLIDGPLQIGTLSGGSGMDWTSPPSLRSFQDPPPPGAPGASEFRIETQTRNGLFVQRVKLSVVNGQWHTSSRDVSGGAFDRGVKLPDFKEAQYQ